MQVLLKILEKFKKIKKDDSCNFKIDRCFVRFHSKCSDGTIRTFWTIDRSVFKFKDLT